MDLVKTYKFRIKNKTKFSILNQMDRDSKFVWNVLNSASRKKWNESRKYFHKFDPFFTSIYKGASKVLSIDSHTIQSIAEQFHKDIRQQKKQLRFKGRKTRGWIPFKFTTTKLKGSEILYKGQRFQFWKSREILGDLKTGCFVQDSIGRWYICITIEIPKISAIRPKKEVGIDLGLKTFATCSDGVEYDLKELESIPKKVAKEQRARNFKRARKLNWHLTNKRKDKLYNFANDLVRRNGLIAVGSVNGFTSGKMAKSRYFNPWSGFKLILKNKCFEFDRKYLEVSENLTTQTCSICGSIEGPKGLEGLGVRDWICSCTARLNRDVNAAKNILSRARALAS